MKNPSKRATICIIQENERIKRSWEWRIYSKLIKEILGQPQTGDI